MIYLIWKCRSEWDQHFVLTTMDGYGFMDLWYKEEKIAVAVTALAGKIFANVHVKDMRGKGLMGNCGSLRRGNAMPMVYGYFVMNCKSAFDRYHEFSNVS